MLDLFISLLPLLGGLAMGASLGIACPVLVGFELHVMSSWDSEMTLVLSTEAGQPETALFIN